MKRLLHEGALSLIICLVFAFSWPGPASASNPSKEESTSVLPDVPYLSLLLLQEEKEGKTPPPPPKAIQQGGNPNKPDEKKAENPNKPDEKKAEQPGNPNKPDGGNQGNVARGSSLPTALIIALIGVVGAAGLWFVLRRRSS